MNEFFKWVFRQWVGSKEFDAIVKSVNDLISVDTISGPHKEEVVINELGKVVSIFIIKMVIQFALSQANIRGEYKNGTS